MPNEIPDQVLDLMASRFRMLADATRLAILRLLIKEGEKNVSEVVSATGRNQANISKHLKQLAEAGLVARRKEGLQVFYRLNDPMVEKLCNLVCESIYREMQDEVDQRRQWLTDQVATNHVPPQEEPAGT